MLKSVYVSSHEVNHLDQIILAILFHNETDEFVIPHRMEEWKILDQIIVKAHNSNARVMELVNFALSHTSKDLDVVKQKLCIALKVKVPVTFLSF